MAFLRRRSSARNEPLDSWGSRLDVVDRCAGCACIRFRQKAGSGQAYLLTGKKIAATLIAAKRRGIDGRVLAEADQHSNIEHSNIGSSPLPELAAAGIAVWLETKY